MKIGKWLKDRPKILERAYQASHVMIKQLDPVIQRIGYEKVNSWLAGPEELSKKVIFDCQMCGQCILHSTGMTCPMTCPKNLRNGPCGGVRANGHCEVKPEMRCVWVEAFERSQNMSVYGNELIMIQPPVNRQLEGSSAWVNMLTGQDKDVPQGWIGTSQIPVINYASSSA